MEIKHTAVDVGRKNADARAVRLGDILRDLIGIAENRGQKRGKILARVVSLEVCGSEGKHRISRRVALVEGIGSKA